MRRGSDVDRCDLISTVRMVGYRPRASLRQELPFLAIQFVFAHSPLLLRACSSARRGGGSGNSDLNASIPPWSRIQITLGSLRRTPLFSLIMKFRYYGDGPIRSCRNVGFKRGSVKK